MSARYQVLPPTAPVPAPDDLLEATAREGARRMLARALVSRRIRLDDVEDAFTDMAAGRGARSLIVFAQETG